MGFERCRQGVILEMTDLHYDPGMIWEPIKPLTILLYAGYTVPCLMPLGWHCGRNIHSEK